MPIHRLVLGFLLVSVGCGDDLSGFSPDAAGRPPDAALPDAAHADAAAADAGGGVCPEGRADGEIGPEGGELTLCGARLTVARGVLAEPVSFSIEVAEAPAPAEPRVLAGPAFRFTADGSVRLPGGQVQIALPHGGQEGRIELFAVERGQLFGIEACTIDEATIAQSVGLLGTFVATVDPYPYADSPDDLGAGTVTGTIGEQALSYAIPEDGYAIDQAWGAPLVMTFASDILDRGNGPEQLRFDARRVDGASSLDFVQWYSGGIIWQLGTPEAPGSTGAIDVELRGDDRLVGTISGTLYAGANTFDFAAEIDLRADYWIFPPERFCPKP